MIIVIVAVVFWLRIIIVSEFRTNIVRYSYAYYQKLKEVGGKDIRANDVELMQSYMQGHAAVDIFLKLWLWSARSFCHDKKMYDLGKKYYLFYQQENRNRIENTKRDFDERYKKFSK